MATWNRKNIAQQLLDAISHKLYSTFSISCSQLPLPVGCQMTRGTLSEGRRQRTSCPPVCSSATLQHLCSKGEIVAQMHQDQNTQTKHPFYLVKLLVVLKQELSFAHFFNLFWQIAAARTTVAAAKCEEVDLTYLEERKNKTPAYERQAHKDKLPEFLSDLPWYTTRFRL